MTWEERGGPRLRRMVRGRVSTQATVDGLMMYGVPPRLAVGLFPYRSSALLESVRWHGSSWYLSCRWLVVGCVWVPLVCAGAAASGVTRHLPWLAARAVFGTRAWPADSPLAPRERLYVRSPPGVSILFYGTAKRKNVKMIPARCAGVKHGVDPLQGGCRSAFLSCRAS